MKKVLRSISSVLVMIMLLGVQGFAIGLPPVPTGTLYVDSTLAGKAANASVTVDGKAGVFGKTAFATVQTAITAAVAGNTINIMAGTYTGQILMSKQVNVKILGNITTTSTFYVQAPSTVEGIANSSGVYPTVDLGTFPTATWGFSIQSDDVIFKNLNIINSKHYAVKPQIKNSGASIQNVTIENINITGSKKTGLDLNGVNNSTIRNVTVKGTTAGTGISLTDSSNIVLDNVVTQNNAWGGISIYTGTVATVRGCDGVTFLNMTPANQVETIPIFSQQVSPAIIKNIEADSIYNYSVTISATNVATAKNEVFVVYFETLAAAEAYSTIWDNAPYTLGYSSIVKEIKKPAPIATPEPTATPTPTPEPTATPAPTPTPVPIPVKKPVRITFDCAYLYGYEMGGVGAEDTIKREEAAALLYRLLKQNDKLDGFVKPAGATFSDVATNRWSFSAVEYMTSIGVFDKATGKVRPGAEITRGEASKIIAYSMGMQPNESKTNSFSDLTTDNKYYNPIKALVDAGILKGYTDNTIKPNGLLTRAEYVTMINRLIGRDSSYDVDSEVNPYPDMSNSHWAYKEIMRASLGFSDDGTGKLKIDPAKKLKRSEIDYN